MCLLNMAFHIAANNSVRKLRLNKLRSGHPFLIYSKELPSRHAYLEFPEGKIVLVTLKEGEQDFTTVRELSQAETLAIRSSLHLELVD
jgi:hypothetical protein